MTKRNAFGAILCAVALSACGEGGNGGRESGFGYVVADQCGYVPSESKTALLLTRGSKFEVRDSTLKVVLSGNVGVPVFWPEYGDSVRIIDFSSINLPGEYIISVDDTLMSYPFVISDTIYQGALRKAARAFYYNRASMSIEKEFGGKWARPAGHPDDSVLVHKSAASAARPEGTVISSSGGWYDAGDYNKYIINSAISTYTLLLASNVFAPITDTLSLNIPESGSDLPDLTSETLYNLRWMLTMQDPNDGGVYAKLTALSFEGFIMPADCHKTRYVVAKSTAAALDLAATAAYASRTLRKRSHSLRRLAKTCEQVSLAAYKWAKANPDVIFHNPEDVSTGEYGDIDINDEWFWAASEMWLMTGDKKYAADAVAHHAHFCVPSWGSVGTLAYYSMVDAGKAVPGIDPAAELKSLADSLLAIEAASPINLSLGDFDWGSNSTIVNHAMLKVMAYKASADKPSDYVASLRNDLHYIFGRNATAYSFVTGVGYYYPMHIHHRPSAADGIMEPIPGFLAGGPNTVVPTDCGDQPTRSQYPARAYADELCSYSTNEIAINWNAPLVFALLAAMSL